MKKIANAIKFIWKNNRVWLLVSSIVLIVIFTATMIATQNIFLRNTINTVMGAERRVLVSGDPSAFQYFTANTAGTTDKGFSQFKSTLDYTGMSDKAAKEATLDEANLLNREIVSEGITLLKNDDSALPLSTSENNKARVSVFGKNSVNLVYGGSGSGGGDVSKAITIYDSLSAANFEFNPTLKSFYEDNKQSGNGRGKNPAMGDIPAGLAIGETARGKYTDTVKSSYTEYKDAAIVVFSRIGGEGFDLPRTMKTSFDDGAGTISGANANDHYLQLDRNERNLLEDVCSAGFGKVIVVINCSTSMELGFIDDGSYAIDAALWLGSPGGHGIMALGEVLNGEVNPSGRLIDTYARDFKKDPSWSNFANNNKTDGNRYTLGGAGADAYFVEYEEGIYVGYRYYETRGYVEDDEFNEGWYDENVVYPFGYGLSYSDFTWEIDDSGTTVPGVLDKNGEISVKVKVTNNHPTRAGKDVVQLYYTPPYREGQIEKSHVVLGAFEKTELIAANGGTDVVTLSLKVQDMASYDWDDKNYNGFKGYELDSGNYTIRLGKNANDSWRTAHESLRRTFSVPVTIDDGTMYGFKYDTSDSELLVAENRFDDVNSHFSGANPKSSLLTRRSFDTTLPTTPTEEEREITEEFIDSLKWTLDDKVDSAWYVAQDNMPTQGWAPNAEKDEVGHELYEVIDWDKDAEKISIDYDNPLWDNILDQITVSEMAYLIGTGNFNTDYIESIGKPKTTDPDGPVGFTNFMGDPTVYDTCFYASECVIGATWNKDLAHDMGVMIGLEGLIGNVNGDGRPYSGWYAPAVNIHRSPFSGRNFEYYSEDGHISGTMGSYVVQGSMSKGVYTYIKHFALNDQETDRVANGLITWADEQTMREVYLKPFEIIVKHGGTTAMMSSFNRIGTTWAGGSYALLTEVLRNEWGFKGMVISDYNLYDYMPADQMIRAGGDLNLTQNSQPTTSSSALTATQVSAMRQATKNILYTVAGSNAMNGLGEGVVYRYAMPMWMLLLIWLNIGLLIACIVWGFFAIRRKLKNRKLPQSIN